MDIKNVKQLSISAFERGVDMTKLDISVSELIVLVVTATALIFCIAFFNGANADGMSSGRYQVPEKNLITQYQAAKVRCDPLFGNAKVLCDAKAEGAKDIATAELEVSLTPTTENHYDVNMIRAGAAFAIAKEQCDSMKEAKQDVCEKVAEESHALEIASAKAQRDMEKSGESRKDKTVKFNESHYKNNPFIIVEFNTIYHVKA